jgi:tetratricopeptide (TPR) repeat protein
VVWEDRDWPRGEAMLRRALALDVDEPNLHMAYALALVGMGREEDALATLLQARGVDPLSGVTFANIGILLLMTGQHDAAVGALRQAMAVQRTAARTNMLGRALFAAGRTEEGIGLLRQPMSFYAGFTGRAALGYALGRAGHTAEAREIAAQYEDRAHTGNAHPTDLALIHIGLGDTARALRWLERAPDRRGLKFYFTDRVWDPVRSSPRFRDVVRRFGITPP